MSKCDNCHNCRCPKRYRVVSFLERNKDSGFTIKEISNQLGISRADVVMAKYSTNVIAAYKVNGTTYYMYEAETN